MKISKNTWAFIIVLIIWCSLTLLRVMWHQPWYDEAHAYIIAQKLSGLDLIAAMPKEGHFVSWFLLIMPFAKLKLWYPYPMQLLNWLFALIAIIILWKKAPFHPVTKSIITFSYPFIAALPVLARCYSLGVMFLYLIAVFYNKSLKHPILYSLLILLAANTNIIALYGVTAFGFVFAYDLIKQALNNNLSRKDFRISFSILAITAILVLWQVGGSASINVTCYGNFIGNFYNFVFGFDDFYFKNIITRYLYLFILLGILIYTPVILYKKNKKLFFASIFTFLVMTSGFIIKYAGYEWHHMYYWIYASIFYWLLIEGENKKTRELIIAEVILALFFFIQLLPKPVIHHLAYMSHPRSIYNLIQTNIKPNSRIIVEYLMDEDIVPYFENNNVEIYSYEKSGVIDEEPAYESPLYKAINICTPWLRNSIAPDKTNYFLVRQKILSGNNNLNTKEPVIFLKDRTGYIRLDLVTLLPNNTSLYIITEY